MHTETSFDLLFILSVLFIAAKSTDVSFNRPRLPANASWSQCGITFADSIAIGNAPCGVFVDTNDTVYGVDFTNNLVLVWLNSSSIPVRHLSGGLMESESVFVTSNGDIYVDNGAIQLRVDRWALNARTGIRVMDVTTTCAGLFVDLNDTLYCSMWSANVVIKTPLNVGMIIIVKAAGTGVSGSEPDQFDGPVGIFVDVDFSLYVADSGNNRVQLFTPGQVNGTAVMGQGALTRSTLQFPRSVILDANGNLYVADSQNHRIVMLGPSGFRCIAACLGLTGSSSLYLNEPAAMAFDTSGNIFVADTKNNRIQKFLLFSDTCESTTPEMPTTIAEEESSSVNEPSTTTEQEVLLTTITTASLTTDAIKEPLSTIIELLSSRTTTSSLDATVDEANSAPTGTKPLSTISSAVRSTQTVDGTSSIIPASTNTGSDTSTEPLRTPFFIPPLCSNTSWTGLFCNVSSLPCDMLHPCQNAGTCINTNVSATANYECRCLPGFSGTDCELDLRPCKSNTCLHNGTCATLSWGNFSCACASGWEGTNCETAINVCREGTCLNQGVCRPLMSSTYECLCLSDFSGDHCEVRSTRTATLQAVARSFVSIAVTAVVAAVGFIVTLDVLKYVFDMDVAQQEREELQEEKTPVKPRRLPFHSIQRLTYIP